MDLAFAILAVTFGTFLLVAGFVLGRLSHRDHDKTRTCDDRMLWHIRDERGVLQNVRTNLRSATSTAKSTMALRNMTSAISHIDQQLMFLDVTEADILGVRPGLLPHKDSE